MNQHTFFAQLEQDFGVQPEGVRPPPLNVIAFVVRMGRGLSNWKQSTLADFAGVSLSTIERIERAERVSPELLERVGAALGYDPGDFTRARAPLGMEAAAKAVADRYSHLTPVNVALLETHRQVRELTQCDGLVIHDFSRDESGQSFAETLAEWIDFTAFVLSDLGADPALRRAGRRARYDAVLAEVARISGQGWWVLCGVVTVPAAQADASKIGVISVTSRKADPAAGARKFVCIDSRHWSGIDERD